MKRAWLAVPLLLVVGGCGAVDAEDAGDAGDVDDTPSAAPEGGTVPATPASLAYVAAEHLGAPDRADEGSNWGPAFREGAVEAELS